MNSFNKYSVTTAMIGITVLVKWKFDKMRLCT